MDLDDAEIVRLYCEEDLNLSKIAGLFGVSSKAIRNHLVWKNVSIRSYKGHPGEKNPFYGKTHTDEVRRKISLARGGTGKPNSETVKERKQSRDAAYHKKHRQTRIEYARCYRKAHRSECCEKERKYRQSHKVERRARERGYYLQLKTREMEFFGPCARCGEALPELLVVDHINEDGADRRRNGERSGWVLLREFEAFGWPDDLKKTYQHLCHNCNIKKHREFLRNRRSNTKHAIYSRRYRERARSGVIEMLGGKCECCGEADQEVLTIDHRKGNGAELREAGEPIGQLLYKKIIRIGLPDAFETYQLLCFNCNFALGSFGYCPHQTGSKLL